MEPVRQFGFLILIVILVIPTFNRWFFSVVFWFFDLSGVPARLAMSGGHLTRFWSAWLYFSAWEQGTTTGRVRTTAIPGPAG